MDEKKVIVYSTTTCPYCVMVKRFLKENNIEFIDKNVQVDQEALREMMNKTNGHMGVPVIDVKGKIILGFDKPALMKALGLKSTNQ